MLRRWQEFYSNRIAWKVGDLTGEDSYSKTSGQFSVILDLNVDSGTFKTFTPPGERPFRTLAEYVDHSFSVMFWNWGFWIALRGGKLDA